MGKRSGVAETEEQVAKMSLQRLNVEIERCLNGFETGGTSQGRKAMFKRLVWLEKVREQMHGISAEQRTWRNRHTPC
jgi:hypothetical protein